MQDCKSLRKEEMKKKIIDKIGEKAFYKIERTYEKIMRMFGVKKEMPFRVKIAFGLHNRIRMGGVKRICWLLARGSISVIHL